MKSFRLVFSLVGLCFSFAYAQDKGKDTKNKRFSTPNIDIQLQDSLQKKKPLNLDSFIQKEGNSVAIPNVYAKKEGKIYTMPIKKLNGNGLAPMPGTENLNKMEWKGRTVGSFKNLGIDKK
jgi:hypothetical protein